MTIACRGEAACRHSLPCEGCWPLLHRILCLGSSCLYFFQWWEGPVVEEALLHQARDFWLQRSALPQSAAQADGARVAPHGLHSFFRVLGAHAFERLVKQIHAPSFEVEVFVLLRIGVVRGVLQILSFLLPRWQ